MCYQYAVLDIIDQYAYLLAGNDSDARRLIGTKAGLSTVPSKKVQQQIRSVLKVIFPTVKLGTLFSKVRCSFRASHSVLKYKVNSSPFIKAT